MLVSSSLMGPSCILDANSYRVDLLSAPKTIRVDLLNFLAAIWTVYFSREQIDGLLSDPQYGSLVDAVLVNRKRAYGVSHKMMFYAYSLHSDPRDFFSRVWQRVKTTGIIGRFGRSVSSRLPLSRRAAAGLLESVVFEQQDASMCSRALKMIRRNHLQANIGLNNYRTFTNLWVKVRFL